MIQLNLMLVILLIEIIDHLMKYILILNITLDDHNMELLQN